MASGLIEDLSERLREADWTDLDAAHEVNQGVLALLAEEPPALRELISRLREDSHLLNLCEHYDILDKLVLHDDPEAGVRLRLHVFLPGYFDRPHNHRWSYSTRVLRGGYEHRLYGPETAVGTRVDVRSLRPLLARREDAGSGYTLHRSMVHAAIAEPYTVSIIVRGPAESDRFLVMDRVENRAWWQRGATDEAPEERAAKRMSTERLDATLAKLTDLGVV